jgi:spermidine/putrescine transport system ATP-binding protein
LSSTAIEAIDVTKSFGDNIAVNNINLTIEEGEFFSFLGPSGCGKTTLLRMIAGFERPSSGQLIIDGKDMVTIPPHKRPVNMVFQSYALFPHMTVADNVAFGLKSKGTYNKIEIGKMAEEALNLVRLGPMSERYPSQLSGGQQQRVALARAAVNKPKVLLLDEPLSALDPQIREEMQEELSRLQRELNLTFVMVTHDQSEALALSHRLAVFSRGNLEQVGTPMEIYEQPRTVFVAQFIGQTNLVPGTVQQVKDDLVEIDVGAGITFWSQTTQPSSERVKGGDEVILLVKPHAVTIGTPGCDQAEAKPHGQHLVNRFEASISSCSYQGFITEYMIRLANGIKLKVAHPNQADDSGQLRYAEGAKVSGSFSADVCSFFRSAEKAVSAAAVPLS